MDADEILLETEERMEKSLGLLQEEFKRIRGARATTGLVENVRVDYYGSPTPLNQIAGISTPEPRLIVVKPYDPSAAKEIEKALQQANLGLNPMNDGRLLRLAVPPLSEERRRQLVQQVAKLAEEAKVSLRNVRRDANRKAEQAKKDSVLTEDDLFRVKEEVQKLTDEFEKKVGGLLETKTKDLLEV